jgi:hypothetical protein
MAAKKKTKGVSPKAPVAGGTAVLAGLVAWLLGVDADVALVIASGIGALIGAVVAPPGNVVTERKPRVAREGGYSAVEVLLVVFLALCCLIVLAWLL